MKFKRIIILLMIISLFIMPAVLTARAGGGGGFSSSGGGGSSYSGGGSSWSSSSSYSSSGSGEADAGTFFLGLIVLIGYLFFHFLSDGYQSGSSSGPKKVTTRETIRFKRLPRYSKAYRIFVVRNNGPLNETEFYKKVETAFLGIQHAWSGQDLSKVRHFLSDGMYQKFSVQFQMMNLLKQKNRLSNIKIHHIYADAFEVDGDYDIIHVGIESSLDDRFVCELDSKFNSGGNERFIEYWSFIRKAGQKTYSDIYSSNSCPSCGGNLDNKLGEVSKCPYCNTLTNNGEYDWVLSEITQASDYAAARHASRKSVASKKLRSKFNSKMNTCIQRLEDKASNAYMQILAAKVSHTPERMRRFVSDSFFNDNKESIENYVFNRLFFNSVDLVRFETTEAYHEISFAVRKTSQRVVIKHDKSILYKDIYATEDTDIITFIRDIAFEESNKGDIYSHTCNNCGGSLDDTLDLNCQYCGEAVNSTKRDWIVNSLVPFHKFKSSNGKTSKSLYIDFTKIDKLYSVRDMALNNMMIMMAMDKECHMNEKIALHKAGRRWGYTKDAIDALIESAMNKKLSFKMPVDPHKRKKIYDLMKDLAKVDGKIDSAEEALLKKVQEHYKIEV